MGCTPASKASEPTSERDAVTDAAKGGFALVAWALFVLDGPALRRLLDARGRGPS